VLKIMDEETTNIICNHIPKYAAKFYKYTRGNKTGSQMIRQANSKLSECFIFMHVSLHFVCSLFILFIIMVSFDWECLKTGY
jgi:hypothetical protein